MTRKALVLGVLAALLASGSARAADDFKVTAGGDQNWGPTSGGTNQESDTQLDVTGTMVGDSNAVGSVDYHAQAGPGIARASLHGDVTVPSNLAYPFNPSLQAVSSTDLTISGPEPEVNLSLNLHVDGVIDTAVCGNGTQCGALSVTISAPTGVTARQTSEFNSAGETRVNELGLAFDPIEGGYHVHGDVTSPVFGLQTGHPNGLGIVLNLSGRFGGNPATSTFGGSLDDPAQRWQVSFAPEGPVLNLPPGYTASGSGVVNNRWDDPFAGDFVVADCSDSSLASVKTIAGSLILRALDDCDAGFPQLEHVGGDIVIDGDRAPHVAFPGPVLVDGSVRVVGNAGDADLDISQGSVGGAIDVSGTGGDLTVDVGLVGGAIDVSGTGGDLTIDPGTTGGDLDLSDNPDAGVVDVGAGQVGGDLTISDDGTAVVDANDSLTVSGNVDVETDGGGMLDLSGVEAEGDETVVADGADGVSAETAGGATDVAILGGTAAMHVVLPDGTLDQPVAFTITRGGDEPAAGGVDPLTGYGFAFAVPVLNADARLAFTIDLAALDAATRTALLAGIASGTATIVSRADAPGSAYSSFARCSGTQTPEADGCVTVTLLAADGSLAPAGAQPAFARFDGIAGHFSTYAVALVTRKPVTPPPGGGPGAGAPNPQPAGPTAAQIRALLRKQIVPHGKASRIHRLLRRRYRLALRALTAGTVTVGWYRVRQHGKPVLVAAGRHRFATAGSTKITMKLTRAGRRALRHAKRFRLRAVGTFTPASAAPVRAAQRFTLRR